MDRERLVNLLRDAQRKAAQYLAIDYEGMYDDISEALQIAASGPVEEPRSEEPRPGDSQTIMNSIRGKRIIHAQPPRLQGRERGRG
jgi:hypothetical protein